MQEPLLNDKPIHRAKECGGLHIQKTVDFFNSECLFHLKMNCSLNPPY